MQAKGQPGNLVLVPKGTRPGTVVTTPKGKVVLEMPTNWKNPTAQGPGPAKPAGQNQSGNYIKLDYIITSENVDITLNKLLASAESMTMLLRTLKDELKPAKIPGADPAKARAIKFEVAKKVRRALDAQVRTLNDLYKFTKNTAGPKASASAAQQQQQRSVLPSSQQSLLKPRSTATAASPKVRDVKDVPELAGLGIGQVLTPSGLDSAVGDKLIISKETLSHGIQLVTLSDGRVLAVQVTPGTPKWKPTDVIELDSSDEDSPKKASPPAKKYKPGPKCSKVNRPGPKCSKVNQDAYAAADKGSDSEAKKDKFKMRISLGAKSFPGSTAAKDGGRGDGDQSEKSESSQSSDDSDDDKPLKPRKTEAKPDVKTDPESNVDKQNDTTNSAVTEENDTKSTDELNEAKDAKKDVDMETNDTEAKEEEDSEEDNEENEEESKEDHATKKDTDGDEEDDDPNSKGSSADKEDGDDNPDDGADDKDDDDQDENGENEDMEVDDTGDVFWG